ncbi:hypothetical protein JQC72_13135 [Polycladomyces sp. WAk]|uniref:Uncharacterized protein n=1 Tax=Polycladomyces zharkentensis TaxID=2807616 RepID=A0ABS2WLN2_9BACL|nr:hypothetical protein [Polycladomyces sp. WAk]MBN2910444.1 hypothetical protein [Polycladomyces sp. WAk]
MDRPRLYDHSPKFLQELLKAAHDAAQPLTSIPVSRRKPLHPPNVTSNEKVHDREFTRLFAVLTGKQAAVPAFQPIRWQSIPHALDLAIESEMEA